MLRPNSWELIMDTSRTTIEIDKDVNKSGKGKHKVMEKDIGKHRKEELIVKLAADNLSAGEKAVFQKRGLARTPPSGNRAKRTNSLPSYWESPDEPEREKRKRAQTPPDTNEGVEEISIFIILASRPAKKVKGKGQTVPRDEDENQWTDVSERQKSALGEVLASIREMCATANELKQLIADNSNTKLDIKGAVEELGRQSAKLDRRGRNLAEIDKLKQANREKRCVSKTTHTQTHPEEDEASSKLRNHICRLAREGLSLDTDTDISVLGTDWPEEIFENVKLAKGGLGAIPDGEDIAVVIDLKEERGKGLFRQLRARFPEVPNLIEGATCGRLEYVVREINVTTSRQEKAKAITKHVLLLPCDKGQQKSTMTADIYKMLMQGIDSRGDRSTETLNVLASENMNGDDIRKILEITGRAKDTQMRLWLPLSAAGKNYRATGDGPNKRGGAGKKVVVKNAGCTYAELVRNVKERVSPAELGVKLKSMRKTSNGDLIMEVEGDNAKASTLRRALEEKLEKFEVRVGGPVKSFYVLDMEPTTTEKELQTALQEEIGGQDGEHSFEIKYFRENRTGNMAATIVTDRATVSVLTKKAKIRVGWVMCRIREKVQPIRCFRCLVYGHRAPDCSGPDRSGDCLRCGQTGHKAAGCTNEEFCDSCGRKGHRTDSANCPHHKKRLSNPDAGVRCKVCRKFGHRLCGEKCSSSTNRNEGGGPSSQTPRKA